MGLGLRGVGFRGVGFRGLGFRGLGRCLHNSMAEYTFCDGNCYKGLYQDSIHIYIYIDRVQGYQPIFENQMEKKLEESVMLYFDGGYIGLASAK